MFSPHLHCAYHSTQNVQVSDLLVNWLPCIRLARGKFELTNQDSAGGKKSSVLTSSKQVRKGFEIRQLFSLKMALNIIQEKGFTISKTIPVCKK